MINSTKSQGPSRVLITYIAVTPVVVLVAFLFLIWRLPGVTESGQHPEAFLLAIIITVLAGAIGGCASNLRRIVKHSDPKHYDPRYSLGYYCRPMSGAIAGFFVFFLLLGGSLSLLKNSAEQPLMWDTRTGIAPYVTVALLAGFASREFAHKIHDLADQLFLTRKGNKDNNQEAGTDSDTTT